jgi:hypothetical protein
MLEKPSVGRSVEQSEGQPHSGGIRDFGSIGFLEEKQRNEATSFGVVVLPLLVRPDRAFEGFSGAERS